MNVLLTCPPMLKFAKTEKYQQWFKTHNLQVDCPDMTQTMTEEELCQIIGNYDGWIIGDDPATRKVFETGKKGKLKACVKWGVGTDNVDFQACQELDIPITNTPQMFGEEVSDVAIGYLLCLSRKLHVINQSVTNSSLWPKPSGETLVDKKVCVVGFGDIGKCVVRKLQAFKMDIWVSDPAYLKNSSTSDTTGITSGITSGITFDSLENCARNANYLISCCPLNNHTHHLVNNDIIQLCQVGVKIINVGRGPVICEQDVIKNLENGQIDSVGFDVFETEPLPLNSTLRKYPQNIFGTHNGSNTIEAVDKVSYLVVQKISSFLK